MSSLDLLGIRHHGPGSARAVAAELGRLRPDIVLIEGPPEADSIASLAADPEMKPPIALLAYVPGETSKAVFWPLAEFSPEWQALRYALEANIPMHFCDLPAANTLAMTGEDLLGEVRPEVGEIGDPLAELAKAGGYDDPERWWEDVVEHREEGAFAAIEDAMTELRQASPSSGPSGSSDPSGPSGSSGAGEVDPGSRENAIREAHMRKVIRQAHKDGHERVAVVCGAWHVPGLRARSTAKADNELLKGLPKVKAELTWVPWTHGRLAAASGYGAGVLSPGWYHHLFTSPDRPVERWLTSVARTLRQEDLSVSSAHVIEAVRLAETLAVLRGRPLAGLSEVTEATRSVLCEGDDVAVALVQNKLVVGELLGEVPSSTPMVPLQKDLRAEQRRLRLPAAALDKEYDFDLRRPMDAGRSRLLHRLALLGIEWGTRQESWGKGTFRESWVLQWEPELEVALIEASVWGTTVAAAAVAKAKSLMEKGDLAALTRLAERCLLSDLPEALDAVTQVLASRAALDPDVAHLMSALPPLVRAFRYGDVRGTPVDALGAVIDPLVTRICIGIPKVVSGIDDDAASELVKSIDEVQQALGLLKESRDLTPGWFDALSAVADRSDIAGLLCGRFTRILLDAGRLTKEEAGLRLSRVASVGTPPARAAGWIEGFLSGGALLLLHDDLLLGLVDDWIAGLPEEAFDDALPLLRRTFGAFAGPEKRAIGERVKRGAAGQGRRATGTDGEDDFDAGRAAGVLRTVDLILGDPIRRDSLPGNPIPGEPSLRESS